MIRLNCRFFRKKLNNFPLPKTFEIIEDECQLEAVKPIYLPDDLEKVKQVPFGISVEQEMREFHKTTYKSGPFYRYTLENIFILKNRIYFEGNEYLLNPLEKALRIYNSDDVVEYNEAAFSSMRISTVFFGHWLHEELMLIDYLQGKQKIITSSPDTPQKKEISHFFELQYSFQPLAKIKVADMHEGWQHSLIYRNILSKYKRKICSLASQKTTSRLKLVYLKRGDSAEKRNLENEKEMLETMSVAYDVECFVAESTPIKVLYSEIYNADVILSIEGSQLAHGIIAGKPGAVLACIQPPFRFYNPFKNYCADAGLKYAIFVAEHGLSNSGFYVDLERFKEFFYMLEEELQS